jgi:hypothetical protein
MEEERLTVVPFFNTYIIESQKRNQVGEFTHCAAIFFVPGGEATIMNVNTKVTENITLSNRPRKKRISAQLINRSQRRE